MKVKFLTVSTESVLCNERLSDNGRRCWCKNWKPVTYLGLSWFQHLIHETGYTAFSCSCSVQHKAILRPLIVLNQCCWKKRLVSCNIRSKTSPLHRDVSWTSAHCSIKYTLLSLNNKSAILKDRKGFQWQSLLFKLSENSACLLKLGCLN